jgi:hypothetical protein
MKMKWTWLMVFLAVLVAGTAFAKERPVQKKAKDLSVEIQMEKDPPVVGMNRVEIVVTDDDGMAVKDAKVILGAFMAAMPGAKMGRSTAVAKWEGGKYRAKIELPVRGTWEMSVQIIQGGNTTAAKWTVNVR